MPDYSKQIRELEEALSTGVRTVTIDGTTHTYASFEEMRKTIDYFRSRDDSSKASGRTRRRMNRIRLY